MLKTNLLNRIVADSWKPEMDGTIVAVYVDRGEPWAIVEYPVDHAPDRKELRVQTIANMIIRPSAFEKTNA
jgi:hypothetical protein